MVEEFDCKLNNIGNTFDGDVVAVDEAVVTSGNELTIVYVGIVN